MSLRLKNALKLLLCLGLLAGCAQVPKSAGFPEVKQMVAERVSYRMHWNQGTPEDAEVAQAIQGLLAKELTDDAAVQIALLNNRSLQATYESLGISQADVVQAGLLHNPTLFASARFPTGMESGTNLEFEIAEDFLEVLMIPARKQLASAQFERTKLKVSNEVLRLVADVQGAYYTLLGAEQVAAMRQAIAEAAEASVDLAKRMHEAGNISDLGLANQVGFFEQARIEWVKAKTGILAARERLNELMGLWGQNTNWKTPDRLPDLPEQEIPLDRLEATAVEQRLDLAAAHKEMETIAHALSISRKQRGIASAEVGVSSERELDGLWVVGPNLKIELPIFHQGQARIARLEAQVRQAEQSHTALAVAIRSQVRDLRNRLLAARNLAAHYRNVVIPVRERIVRLTLQQYNFMLVGIFELIVAKQNEFEAYNEYLEAIGDYWVVRSKLQHAVGGRLPAVMQKGQIPTKSAPQVALRTSMKKQNQPVEGGKR